MKDKKILINPDQIAIEFMPAITDEALWQFYLRNDICEVGYGRETAVKPLRHNPYIVAAFYGELLVGIIRTTFDGVTATIMEFCLECQLQGDKLRYANGSVIEADQYGIAKKMGLLLLEHLEQLGNTFTTAYIVSGVEESVYTALGLTPNDGHAVYVKDCRPYVNSNE